MNIWNFTGNLGNSAEQRFTSGGDSVVNFSVAVKSGYGDKAVTTWVNCQMWGKRGESVLPYLSKGALVGVSGETTLRKYDKKDGGDGFSLDVRVNDLTLLGSKSSNEPEKAAPAKAPANGGFDDASSGTPPDKSVGNFDDDIPFAQHGKNGAGVGWREL